MENGILNVSSGFSLVEVVVVKVNRRWEKIAVAVVVNIEVVAI